MNTFDFFYRVACRVLQVEALSDNHMRQVGTALLALQEDFKGSGAIEYSDLNRKLAYTLVYAPRYALYWKHVVRAKIEAHYRYNGFFQIDQSPASFNCIGPGPGSDIAGLLIGIEKPANLDVHVCCLEREETWWDFISNTAQLLEEELRITVNLYKADAASELLSRAHTLGSFVLTDVARREPLAEFMEPIVEAIRPCTMFFLDTPSYTDPGGKECYLSNDFRELDRFDPDHSYLANLNDQFDREQILKTEIDAAAHECSLWNIPVSKFSLRLAKLIFK